MFGALTGPVLPAEFYKNPDDRLVRVAIQVGYRVNYLKPTMLAYTAAHVLGNQPLPSLAVLRKG